MEAWTAFGVALAALISTAVTAVLSYRSEKKKATTVELERVNERAERYWKKIEDQQDRIVSLEAKVYVLTSRLARYEEVP